MLRVCYGARDALNHKAVEQVRELLGARRHCLILVPETATLKTERFFLTALGLRGTFDMEVLSPSRLEDKVFSVLGRGDGDRVTLDERGKAVAVAAALKDCRKDLTYYTAAADFKGFVERASDLIRDLKRANLTPETLAAFAEKQADGFVKSKMADLALIWTAYRDRMGDRLVDGEDVNRQMLRRLEEGEFARGDAVICLDFDLITLSLSSLLLTLSRGGAEVTLYQRYVPGDNLYRPVGDSLGRLRKAAAEWGQRCEFAYGGAEEKGSREDLRILRERYPLDQTVPAPGVPEHIRLFVGGTPYEEAEFAVSLMCRRHREGVPWNRMSVVLLSPDEYYSPLKRLLEVYGVPHYLPRPLPAIGHDAARFLVYSLRCAFAGYRGKDLLSLLQCGYTGLEDVEAWQLAAYIEAYGIQGRRFIEPFTRGDEEEIAAASAARDKLLPPLARLREATPKGTPTDDLLTAIMAYLEETGVYDRLLRVEKELVDLGLMDQAVQGRQMWDGLMGLMDQMHEIMGGEPLPRGLLLTQIESALEAARLNGLPPDSASVQCLPAGGVAQEGMDAVFIMGFNDDAFSPGQESLIPDAERAALEQFGKTWISPDLNGREDLKRLDLYRALCSAEGELVLSRASASQKGEAKRAHPYWNHVRDLFPDMREEGGLSGETARRPETARQAAEELVRLFSSGEPLPPLWKAAWRELNAFHPDLTQAVLDALKPPENIVRLSRAVAEQLYPERSISVSRLEAFAACPYKHFVAYGLRPAPKKEWRVDSAAAGSFYHSALEKFIERLQLIPGWPGCLREQVDHLVEEVSAGLFDTQFGEMAADLPRVQALREKYLRVLKRVAWAFTISARQCAFKVMGSEIKFGFPEEGSLPPVALDLPNGDKVLLRGVIDRVDRYEGDEGVYFRVVDYKSGARELEPEQIYYGTQLQLLLYLAAAEGGADGAEPAGAYYMRLTDAPVPDPGDQAALEKALARKCALNGITLRDVRVVRLMDSERPPVSMENLLSAKGDFLANKPVATMEDLRLLILHARESARRMFVALRNGVIERQPLSIRGKDGRVCEYCDYAAICRVEEAGKRRGDSMTYEELFQRLRRQDTDS